jgi:Chaperone of endosialidase
VAVGSQALQSNATTGANTAVGYQALASFTTGLFGTDAGVNTAVGFQVLANATTGVANSGFGYQALFSNIEGTNNAAIGARALFHNTIGDLNTAMGGAALDGNTEGDGNTAIGAGALDNNITGNLNVALGFDAGTAISTASNVICIGADVAGVDVDDSCYIGNIWNQAGGSQAVYVSSEGKLGQMVSSKRFKDEIRPMEQASEVIYALKPVSFRYKAEIEPTRPLCFGLIAEEVEKISGDLVTRGSDGKVNSVRYDAVNAMLLNEFLKEHRKVEELEARIAQDQKSFESKLAKQEEQIEALTSSLQKVNAQVEMIKAARRVVANQP